MFKVLICPNSFKECLNAIKVAKVINKTIKKKFPNIKTSLMPLGDGGDGTLDSLIFANPQIKKIFLLAQNPLHKKIKTYFGFLFSQKKAFLEMAKISGLALLKPEEKNPLKTTAFGLGEVLKKALSLNPKIIYLGIGGSATNDGGLGMLQALGIKFLDKNNFELAGCGESLVKVKKIFITEDFKKLRFPQIIVLSDVKNYLLGKSGATFVFAPQKGADKKMVLLLEKGMKNYVKIVSQTLKKDFSYKKGSGAAGGVGFALNSFLKANYKYGLKTFSQLTNLEEKIKCSNLIITGEGKFDGQSFYGKAPYEIYKLAQKYNKEVYIFAGKVEKVPKLKNLFIYQITPDNIPLNLAFKKVNYFLQKKVKEVFKNKIF